MKGIPELLFDSLFESINDTNLDISFVSNQNAIN
jgi:hypothetical protein